MCSFFPSFTERVSREEQPFLQLQSLISAHCYVLASLCLLDPEGSLSAMTVVLAGVVTRFRKMPKALLIRNGK